MPQKPIISRRNLPHWFVPEAFHFVTFRLHGTLPAAAIEEIRARKEEWSREKNGRFPAGKRAEVHKRLFALYDGWLDRSRECADLAYPRVAALVRASLLHLHDRQYHLLAYCVMPNHVHALFRPLGDHDGALPIPPDAASWPPAVGEQSDGTSPLSRIMHSLKSYTAHEANKILKREGPIWQSESYDHWVRSEEELERIVRYIADNPVKAGLVKEPQDWYFCSTHDRFVQAGDPSGHLVWKT